MKCLWPLLALLLALPVQAATYWVAPVADGGSASNSGADSTTNAKTLAWFNANAVAGDVCRFKSGDYLTTPIAPVNNGTSGARIRYYGFPQDPGAVRVFNIQFGHLSDPSKGDYCTARWITTTNAFRGMQGLFNYGAFPTGDSIVACRSTAANQLTVGGTYHVIDSLTLTGTNTSDGDWILVAGGYDCDVDGTLPVERCDQTRLVTHFYRGASNQIKNSTFTMTRNSGTGDFKAVSFVAADSTIFFNNTITLTLGTTAGGFMGLILYNSDYNWIQGNTWTFTMNATPAGTHGMWSLRDWCVQNRFLSNTVTVTGSGQLSLMPTNYGSVGGSTRGNYYGYNTIKVATPQSGQGVFWFQDGLRSDTLEYNTVATSSTNALLTISPGQDNDSSIVRHNSFLTAGATAVDLSGGTGSHVLSTRLTSNVYYCQTANSTTAQNLRVNTDVDIDSAGVYFSLGGGAASASNAIRYGSVVGAPGSGSGLGGTESKWCSPTYADSAYATFDGRVSSACAIGTTWHDGFVGIGKTGADVTKPVVEITSPTDTSYVWTAQETMPVVWTASDAVGVSSINVDIGVGIAPVSWSNLVTGLAGGTTTYSALLSSSNQRYGAIRVRAFDAAGNVGEDTQVFRINVAPGRAVDTRIIDP